MIGTSSKKRALINNAVTRWMFQKDISPGDIVMATKAPKSTVSMTLSGARRDSRVIGYLRDKGCPDLLIESIRQKPKGGRSQ